MLKNIFKSIFCIILVALMITAISVPCFAAEKVIVNQGVITIGKVSGNTGDTVIVPITIEDNPGIIAITISITYDSSALQLIEDLPGNVIFAHEIQDHPSKNLIRLVTLESLDRKNNGTLISLKFKIKPKTKAGLTKISIKYGSGDFCNWKLHRIMPEIIPGGVDVGLSEDNCPHKNYSDWTVAAIPTCLESGYDSRTCNDCGHVELRNNSPIGHEFSKDFTIDKAATKEESGLMSRHCIRCAEFVDQISYTLKDSTEGDIKNEFGNVAPPNDYVNNLVAEQIEPESSPEVSSSETGKNNSSEVESSVSDSPNTQTENNPTTSETEEVTVKDKILEAFPKGKIILIIFIIAIIILIIALLI
ncbi:MAG: hypothetical protein IJP34_00135 [Clostridia bacterium]|nr:hypothetical protein [Clostridia bacterium]